MWRPWKKSWVKWMLSAGVLAQGAMGMAWSGERPAVESQIVHTAVLNHEIDRSLVQVKPARLLTIWPSSRWGRQRTCLSCAADVFETEAVAKPDAPQEKPVLPHSGVLKCPWPQFCENSSLLSADLWRLPPVEPTEPEAAPADRQPEFEIARTRPR